jgi:Integrase zinc binding domain
VLDRAISGNHQPSSLPSINVLFANLGVHSDLGPELRERILHLPPADTGVERYLRNPTSPWSQQGGFLLHNGLVYLPDPLRLDVIRKHHDGPLLGHPGVSKTCGLVTRNHWFPHIPRLVQQYVDSCHLCQTVKPSRHA